MHIQYDAQRKHITASLEALLYQLHILSYLMSPSILALVTRTVAQLQLAKPREIDAKRTLPFWYTLIILFNLGSVWAHATQGATEGRAVILDFIGMAFRPSKSQLILLDITIVFLSTLLTTIAYDTSYRRDTRDITESNIFGSTAGHPLEASMLDPSPTSTTTLIVDVHLQTLMRYMRHSPPPPQRTPSSPEGQGLLPLPNTTTLLPENWRLLMHARTGTRARGEDTGTGVAGRPLPSSVGMRSNDVGLQVPGGRVPGGIDEEGV
ncbi:hypothetical protein DENSPDRAFT_840406 [Dentipellis sp. KUC8613]|nr:hypothetical protein DENSPDRAFT_840406 [Dentipellis sp. KUC8613]